MVTLARDEIKWALWTRVARDFQVCFGQKKTEERLIFEGFHRDVRFLDAFLRSVRGAEAALEGVDSPCHPARVVASQPFSRPAS